MDYGQAQAQQPVPGQYPPIQHQPGAPQNQYGQYPPIQHQPGAPQNQQGGPNWMPIPMTPMPNYNPALVYLSGVDHLLVKQKKEMIEIFLGYESANKYEVKNSQGQTIFMAMEDSDCCSRNLCANLRPLDIKIIDGNQTEVMSFSRPLACTGCCFPCCLQVLSSEGRTQVGKISKKWGGILKESFTDADTFGINFPMDLDVKVKASLLGALFLIDFLYFDRTN